jgi:hypothetical protein
MPDGSQARVANASRMVEAALDMGIPVGDIFIDPLVFPVSVDKVFGLHCLDAICELRGKFGADIHITGGLSNVSFGVPARKMINDVFIILAVEAGADSGIVDPVSSGLNEVFRLHRDSLPYRLAEGQVSKMLSNGIGDGSLCCSGGPGFDTVAWVNVLPELVDGLSDRWSHGHAPPVL